jgi:hypothetical protein
MGISLIALLPESATKMFPFPSNATALGPLNPPPCQCWLKIPHSAGRKFPHLVVVTVYSFSRLARK